MLWRVLQLSSVLLDLKDLWHEQKNLWITYIQGLNIFTARKWSLLRLCFYTCLSVIVQGGFCLSACWDTPQEQTPSGSRHPPLAHPPLWHIPLSGTPPSGTPLWHTLLWHTPPSGTPSPLAPLLYRACWEIQSMRGRYASYWNAILLYAMTKVKVSSDFS